MLFVKPNQGFTLIELLIASVILMSAIALSQVAYSQYVKLIIKQKGSVDKYLVIMQAKNLIDLNMDVNNLTGTYTFNAYTINWQGEIKDSFREKSFESDVNGFSDKPYTYYLIDYTFVITTKDIPTELPDTYSRFLVNKDETVSFAEH